MIIKLERKDKQKPEFYSSHKFIDKAYFEAVKFNNAYHLYRHWHEVC
jgi:hypothetical protein